MKNRDSNINLSPAQASLSTIDGADLDSVVGGGGLSALGLPDLGLGQLFQNAGSWWDQNVQGADRNKCVKAVEETAGKLGKSASVKEVNGKCGKPPKRKP